MKSGRSWACLLINAAWNSCDKNFSLITFDNDGYPTYLPTGFMVVTVLTRDLLTHYDIGTYVILYDGDGIIDIGLFDIQKIRRWVGRIEVDVVPSTNFNNGFLLFIKRTNVNNPIRNIKVIRPGFEKLFPAVTFHPMFLSKIKPFSTLRFMDWQNTNGQKDTEWNTRTTLSRRSYTSNGVAYEEIIRLANLLGKNIWINIPHLATMSYITKFASFVK
jgi:hypothetical protein